MKKSTKILSVLLILAALFGLIGSGLTVKDVLSGKDYWSARGVETDENLTKLEDGLALLEENEQAYLDGRKQLEDGQKTYDDGLKEYEDGQKLLTEKQGEYDAGVKKLADAEKQLASGRKTLNEKTAEYNAGLKKLNAGKAKLDAGKAELDKNRAAYEEGKKQLDALDQATINAMTQVHQQVDAVKAKGLDQDAAINAVASAMVDQAIAQNEGQIRDGVTAAVRQAVEAQVTAAVRDAVAQQAGVPSYAEAPDEVKQAIDAQMGTDAVKAQIAQNTDAQMGTDAVKQTIEQNVADQKAKLKNEQLPGAVAQVKQGYEGYESYVKGKALIKQYEDGMAEYQAGLKEYNAGKKQLDDGARQLAAGRQTLANGEREYNAGKKQLADGKVQLEEGKQKLEDAEKQLTDGKEQLEDGKKQLAEFEDGRDQLIDGLNTAMGAEADPGLTSIKDRLGEDFSFMKNDTDLDIEKGKEVVAAARAYSADSGDLITKEITQRAIGAGSVLLASLAALLAGIFGLGKKQRKASVPAIITTALGALGTILAVTAGMYYSNKSGAQAGYLAAIAGAVLAVLGCGTALSIGKKDKTTV